MASATCNSGTRPAAAAPLELFSLKKGTIQSFSSVRISEVTALLESLNHSATKEEAVDVGEMLSALTASVMFKITFGTCFKGSVIDDSWFQKMINETESLLGTFAAADCFPYIG